MRRTVISVLFALVAVPSLHAQHMNEPDSPCRGIAVTVDLTNCLSKATKKADAQMNAVYSALRKSLESSDRQRLVAAERLWLQYRAANCSAEQELYGEGTARYPAYYGCMEAMTRARIKELQTTYAAKLKD